VGASLQTPLLDLGLDDFGLSSLGLRSGVVVVPLVLTLTFFSASDGELGVSADTRSPLPPSLTFIFFAALLRIFSSSSEEG
jgi:hypothetical protein